jgi:SpoVK/Ycf46/Vps4 family AAA+-type ATPase
VGASEANLRKALKVVDAMAPCNLFVDEIEKALAGASVGAHVGDSGVSVGMFGTLLTWLNDHTTDVFFVAAANDITLLPSEFTRAERFDRIFFVETPSKQEREVIWDMYLRKYRLSDGLERPEDNLWTGAEVKACCRIAKRLSRISEQPLLEAAKGLVPVAMSAAEVLDARRKIANNAYTDANTGDIYRIPSFGPVQAVPAKKGRKVSLPEGPHFAS